MDLRTIVYHTEVKEAAEDIMRESEGRLGYEFRTVSHSSRLLGSSYRMDEGVRQDEKEFVVTQDAILGDDPLAVDALWERVQRNRKDRQAR